jgi:hypothetical protein
VNTPKRWDGRARPRWDYLPPAPKVRKYDRVRVLPGKPQRYVIVSTCVEEIGTHFVDLRTVPCTGEQGACWLDHSQVGKPRYTAWLAVKSLPTHRVYLLPLTAVAVSVEPRLRDSSLNLRGITISVWRTGLTERSEMHAKLHAEIERVDVTSECPDVRFCVERLLEASDRHDNKNRAARGQLQEAYRSLPRGEQPPMAGREPR